MFCIAKLDFGVAALYQLALQSLSRVLHLVQSMGCGITIGETAIKDVLFLMPLFDTFVESQPLS